jgi:hypothetical protein
MYADLSWVAQLLKLMAMGKLTEGSECESRQGQDFPSLHDIQAGSRAHPSSTQCVPGVLSPGSPGLK